MVMRVVVTEEQKKGISHKLMGMIDNNGLLNTIKFMGGYDNFITLLPDYFDSRESKIELIIEIIGLDEQHPVYGGGGRIYLHELGSDILYDQFDGDDGHTFESYIDYIENYNDNLLAHVTVWEFDEDGQMYDEYYDDYDVRVNKLETKYLNKLFEMLVNNYLS
jgi:hypothetical protein